MKMSIGVMFICALGYGSAIMADCGDESAASSVDESTAPAAAPVDAPQAVLPQAEMPPLQEAKDHFADRSWTTVPARHNFLYTPYEDEGYKP